MVHVALSLPLYCMPLYTFTDSNRQLRYSITLCWLFGNNNCLLNLTCPHCFWWWHWINFMLFDCTALLDKYKCVVHSFSCPSVSFRYSSFVMSHSFTIKHPPCRSCQRALQKQRCPWKWMTEGLNQTHCSQRNGDWRMTLRKSPY